MQSEVIQHTGKYGKLRDRGQANCWEKSLPDTGNSQCKVPEVDYTCGRSSKEAPGAGVGQERMRGRDIQEKADSFYKALWIQCRQWLSPLKAVGEFGAVEA